MPQIPKEPHRTALFAGSFDPLTLGHLDLIRSASALFKTVIVAIGESATKTPVFNQGERRELIAKVCAELPNVRVEPFSGLAVAYAEKVGAGVLVRGLRSATDFDYEMQMAQMNKALLPSVQTLFLPTKPEFRHISSSLAKEIARHGGAVELLVPPAVAVALNQKMHKA